MSDGLPKWRSAKIVDNFDRYGTVRNVLTHEVDQNGWRYAIADGDLVAYKPKRK